MNLTVEHNGKIVDLKPLQFVNGLDIERQTPDAIRNIRHSKTLGLPELKGYAVTKGKCIIVGGAPSVAKFMPEIKRLAEEPENAVFALNYMHNLLIANGVIPKGCVLFEIDADPTQILEKPHPLVNYFVCSLCHPATFEALKGYSVTVWHALAGLAKNMAVQEEYGPDAIMIGGGCQTFLRTVFLAYVLGFRKFEIFGCDSSFPNDGPSTHIDGYAVSTTPEKDGIDVWCGNNKTGEKRQFRTAGYLAEQAENFRQQCQATPDVARMMHVHGDSLLRYIHETDFPECYQ